jgi:N-hydroxyarylamine O-acetyltransferase
MRFSSEARFESASPVDLSRYFARIGYAGSREPSLSVLHALTAAHVHSIPFENLSVVLGQPVPLEPEALFRKLVNERRGGYCFEQNGLFLAVLAQLGFAVKPISARVRLQRPRDFTPPRTHVFLRVELGGESWLTDVGVGALSLTAALRLELETAQVTPHETRRIVREGARYFHQALLGGEWSDVCEFTLEEMPPIDREVANWFTSSHPQSHFKNRLIASRAAEAGRRVNLLNDELSIRGADGQATRQPLASARELISALREHFALEFPDDTVFGPPGSPWPT